MTKRLKKARQLRKLWEFQAAGLSDEQAVQVTAAFPAWAQAENYAAGDRVAYGGVLYKCLTTHTAQEDWTPEASPSLWVRMDDPGEEWPVWRQPQSSEEAYAKGAKVSHEGRRWVSQLDANVWVPGEYGWTEAN